MPEPEADAANTTNDDEEQPQPRRRLWAPSAKYLTMDYLYAEDFRGIGQEHLLCLNRGGANTGSEWFVREIAAVAMAVKEAGSSRLSLDVWWGGQDGMVPRNGQGRLFALILLTVEWLNKAFAAHPKEIKFTTHFVEDGDHSDLYGSSGSCG